MVSILGVALSEPQDEAGVADMVIVDPIGQWPGSAGIAAPTHCPAAVVQEFI